MFRNLRSTRLGGARADRSFRHSAVLAGGADGQVVNGDGGRALRGALSGDMCRLVALHSRADSDVVLTLSIALALWSFLRALDEDEAAGETHWRLWSLLSWAAIGTGMLLKGLIAALFPVATALLFLLTGLWRERRTWRRLSILPGLAIMLAIAAPWHVLATAEPSVFRFHNAQRAW